MIPTLPAIEGAKELKALPAPPLPPKMPAPEVALALPPPPPAPPPPVEEQNGIPAIVPSIPVDTESERVFEDPPSPVMPSSSVARDMGILDPFGSV